MEGYRIGPWDHLTTVPAEGAVEYVPPEVEEIARQVCSSYDMNVSSMVLITSKPDKGGAIWKIETDKGPRSLKVLHREPLRSLFSVYAQIYLVEQGARVPAILPTKDNRLYVEAGGKLWIVTDWVAITPASKTDLAGAAQLIYGLGEFHRWTRGYIPPKVAGKSSRLFKWPKHYAKMIEKIGWFRDLAEAYPETAGSPKLLAVVEEFERQAREALARFELSSYGKMTLKGEPYWGLVHQDYGWSNGQVGPGGVWVIDLDGVAYDFPIRDLRKLITSTMDDMGVWDTVWIRGMIQAYHEANPMDRETFELLLIDMAFPNEFYKHIKEMIFDPVLFLNTELDPILQRVMATEASKKTALADLANDIDNYPAGDYAIPEEVAGEPYQPAQFVYEGARAGTEPAVARRTFVAAPAQPVLVAAGAAMEEEGAPTATAAQPIAAAPPLEAAALPPRSFRPGGRWRRRRISRLGKTSKRRRHAKRPKRRSAKKPTGRTASRRPLRTASKRRSKPTIKAKGKAKARSRSKRSKPG